MTRTTPFRTALAAAAVFACATLLQTAVGAQNRTGASALRGVPALPPPDRPVVLYTAEQPRIRVVPIVTGLDHPWGMAFRRNGDILVTERDRGTLRVIRNGQLLDEDIPGVPEVFDGVRLAGLMDVVVHPEDDTLVYLTYSKAEERDGRQGATVALARGRLDAGAGALTEVRDIFVADGWGGGIAASRLIWGPDNKLFMTVGGAFEFAGTGEYAQDPGTHFGKLLRLNDDGTAPDDNPFVGEPDHHPEIWTMGHRNQIGLAFHPDTGELWRPSTACRAATRPTSFSRAPTTAGPSRPTAAPTAAGRSRRPPGGRSSRDHTSCGGRRSRPPVSPSTTASTSPPGAATSSSAP